jgi:hypothetical protein
MEDRELPLACWYPNTIEPQINEPIMFCSMGCIRYYTELAAHTGAQISMPSEVMFGSYLGNGLVEIAPGKPPANLGVWAPMPLFFFESSVRSLMAKKKPKKTKL